MQRSYILLFVIAAACSGRYHPDNYAQGAIHGPDLKTLKSDCRSCHGSDLAGGTSSVSCDGCHAGATPVAWRTDCVFCHGGVDNQTGAPPRNLDGTDQVGPFPDHTIHVTGGAMAAAYDCTQCHVKAKDVLSQGHIFDNPKGGALNDFGAGLSPQGTFDKTTGTCSNLYCHGTGQGDNGTVVRGTSLACGGCHATMTTGAASWAGMSGPHALHLGGASPITCAECHADTTTDSMTIASTALHINGIRDVKITAPGFTYQVVNASCTGTCHGFQHSGQGWSGGGTGSYHPPGYVQPTAHGVDMELQRQDCRGCHGTTLAGGTTGQQLVGPSCDGCHSGATTTSWRSNCTFCHGNSAVDQSGMPPRDPGSSNTSVSQRFIAHAKHVNPTMMSPNTCTACHIAVTDVMTPQHAFDDGTNVSDVLFDSRNSTATFTETTGTCSNLYCHGNGQGSNGTVIDGTAPMTCTSCHGGSANNLTGLSGEHRNDHNGIACATCHNATVSSNTTISNVAMHINGTNDVAFANGGTYTPSTKTCSNIGCHGTQRW